MQIWESFQHTGLVGKVVFAILVAFSVLSWAAILLIWVRYRRAGSATRRFLGAFRKSRRLMDVQAVAEMTAISPLVGLFRAGYAEIESQVGESGRRPDGRLGSLDSVARSLQRAAHVESARLTRNLPFLATTAAATPFIGLFGTVWGIMVAFASIGTTGSTSIVAVAPGISEALVNTAAGLFAAIPALIFYNVFLSRLREARGEMEDFSLEFLNLTERNFM
ncbi:MAG TPA: MotA/TolQ/ExbB proton channel family protein [Thermoanaerobaculia bacterium]|nr:MotA/TolQ/ExbB proton channel family protein [Thermoanaerobaculia bacterium]